MRPVALVLSGCLLSLVACQSPANMVAPVSSSHSPDNQSKGEDLADALCMGCHVVKDTGLSPHPEAPSFASIANRDGLTRETLGDFLHDSYSFPVQMEMELSDEDADAIADYILTLRTVESSDES